MSYSDYTDKELVLLLKEGDDNAFTEIYHRYAGELYRFSWFILAVEDECNDAIQDVFVWIWENRESLHITTLKHYLLAAVKYKLIKAIQKSRRRKEILSDHPVKKASYNNIEESIELSELKAVIHQFSQNLPSRARQVFRLSREEHKSNREIASKMDISEKTVENQMTISLRKLRHTLGRLYFFFMFL